MTDKPTPTKAAAKGQSPVEPPRKGPKPIQLVRGMKDILPGDMPLWQHLYHLLDNEAVAYGFERIETPIVEASNLFLRSIGGETDIVEKEMYTFQDKGGDSLTLRPEFTAGIVRAYVEHGMLSWPQPVKLFTSGPVFRYDRPQAGRYRQFTQANFEVIGDPHPVVDAELLILLNHFFQQLQLPISIQMNSIGDATCRPQYRKALLDYYRNKKAQLCEDCQRRILKNPLRVLDCKVPQCHELAMSAPQTIDHLCEPCREHFTRVLEYLDDAQVPYNLNSRIIRGLDYYARTTFELWTSDSEEGAQSALGGGGRYDSLVEQLGGRPGTPAVGFGLGLERIINRLRELQYVPPRVRRADVFIAQLGEPAKKRALGMFNELRANGHRVVAAFSKEGLKPQLEIANRLGVKYSLILGQKEMLDDTVLVRDMENGIQEVVDFKKIVPEIGKRLQTTIIDNTPVTNVPFAPERKPRHDELHDASHSKDSDEPSTPPEGFGEE